MPSLEQVERVLWVVSFAASILLTTRMVLGGLHRTYVWFFRFLCFSVAEWVVAFPLDPSTNAYAWVYLVGAPLGWLFNILVVLEIYSLLLRGHPGIASVGRWALSFGFGISVAISVLTLWADASRPFGKYPLLDFYTVLERGVVSSLLIFLLFITLFLVWYPIPLTRNLVVHANIFAVYFLTSTLALFMKNITGEMLTRGVSTVLTAVSALCLLLWVIWFTRKGEKRLVVLRPRWRPEDEQRLVQQIDALNATLLKTRK